MGNSDTETQSTVRAPFAPWDRRELPGLFDVEETARRVGNYKWTEMKLFEALGGWIATVPETVLPLAGLTRLAVSPAPGGVKSAV